jgi:hypothetical protein
VGLTFKDIREAFGRAIETGHAETLVHSPEDLRRILADRGQKPEQFAFVGCRECGAMGPLQPATVVFGLGHFPECEALDRRVYFLPANFGRQSSTPRKP